MINDGEIANLQLITCKQCKSENIYKNKNIKEDIEQKGKRKFLKEKAK